ncbi:hypothetical protein CU098_000190, partial [Rhizopus stolonifer]
EETVFKTIVRSTLDRHSPENAKMLANPKFLTIPVRVCEEITTFTCYGWQMGLAEWEQLSIMAKSLVKLHIIGGFPQKQLSINNFLSRLTSLHLDGCFNIDETWAINLINRATHLDDLQLSLNNLQYSTLEKICTPDHLRLKKLTLTGASEIRDPHVYRVLQAFPDLIKFCLEGCTNISTQTILISLTSCPYLQHLEIRADPKTFEKTPPTFLNKQQPAWTPKLTNMLIENMNITDENVQAISLLLPQLQVLGLKDCPRLTNQGLEYIVANSSIKHLSQLHIINCPSIHSGIFSVDNLIMASSIYDLYIESCGPVSPIDIHRLCNQSINHHLQHVRLVNYHDLKSTIMSTFDCTPKSTTVFSLNKMTINSLAHSDDPQLCATPSERLLTGRQIVLLAKHLDMTTEELISLFDEAEKIEHEEAITKTQFNTAQPVRLTAKSHVSRLEALKSSVSPRPSTPSIWSKDFIENGEISALNENNVGELNQMPSDSDNYREEDEEEDYEDYEEEDEEEQEEIVQETEEIVEEVKDEVESLQKDELQANLGGWGVSGSSNEYLWSRASANEPILTQPKVGLWSKAENINTAELWQQQDMEPSKKLFKTPESNNHFRNSPFIREGEGWGEPEKVIPWSDLRTQGYAHDLLKEQKETTFWRMVDGVWTECQGSELPSEAGEQIQAQKQTEKTRAAPQSLFSIVSADQERNQPSSLSFISSDENSSCNNDDEHTVFRVNPNSKAQKPNNKPSNKNNDKKNVEQFLSEVTPQENAKDEWANIAKSNPVARKQAKPSRGSRRTANREQIPPESMSGRWKKFTEESLEPLVSLSNNTPPPVQQTPQTLQQDFSPVNHSIVPAQQTHQPASYSPPPVNQASLSIQQTPSQLDLLVDLDDDIKTSLWPMNSTMQTNNILVPDQLSSKKKDSSTSVETLFWFNDSVDEKKEEKPSQELHFSSLVPGTTTSNDNYKKNTENLLELDDIPTPSFSQKSIVNENTNLIPAPILAPTLAPISAPKSEPTLSPTLTTTSVPMSTPASAPTSAPHPTHLSFNNVPVNTPPPEVPNGNSEDEIKAYKAQPNYLGSLKVYVAKDVYKYLIMFLDEEVEESVRKFCQKHNVEQNAANLLEQAKPLYLRRRTKKILKKKNKEA